MNVSGSHRAVVSAVALVSLWSGALVLAAASGSTPSRASNPPAAALRAGAQGQSGGPASGYAGDATCLTCHAEMTKGYADSAHGRKTLSHSPAASQGCESCHGPGATHADDPSIAGAITLMTKLPPRQANEACLSCHKGSSHALWRGSAHDARNMSCASCHSVHNFKSAQAQLKTRTEAETCGSCHKLQARKVLRIGHMPLAEGKMECSSCHNPHGATNVKLLRAGNWINESCVSCHAEKRGPFLFEHAAGRESCVTCHDPHGSSNDRMLVAKLPMLCQRCHIGTRHPSTIYDNRAVAAKSNRIIGRGCINCHQNIHGSNHPSGGTFLR